MSSYIDLKFINSISSRLNQFKKKNDYLFNFRCPHCGDSQKSKTKARAYLYRVKNGTKKNLETRAEFLYEIATPSHLSKRCYYIYRLRLLSVYNKAFLYMSF